MAENARKNTKEQTNLLRIVLIAVLALLVIVVVLLPGNRDDGGQRSGTDQPTGNDQISGTSQTTGSDQTTGAPLVDELVIHSTREEGEWVWVSTSYGDFRYPYAFAELVAVEAKTEADRVALLFSACINGKNEPAYTLWIHKGVGTPAGLLAVQDRQVMTYVQFHSPDSSLGAEDMVAFYAAQETLNDVLQSMVDAGILTYTD